MAIFKSIRKQLMQTIIRHIAKIPPISSEIEEMLRTCDRMIVMRDTSKVGELSGEEMNQTTIMSTIAGGQ